MSDKTVINNWNGGGTLQTWTDGEWQILYAKDSAGNCVTLSLTSQDAIRLAYAVSSIPNEQFERLRAANEAVYELSYPEARSEELRQVADVIDCGGDCGRCGSQSLDRGEFCDFVAAENLRKLASALDLKAAISKPAPVDANASAEARLRWALKEAQRFIASVSDISPSVQRRRDSVWTLLDKAISVLPYTAKSEGGLNEQARNPVRLPDGSGDLASAGGIARDDIKDHHRQVGGNSPSDRTSDVMEGWTGQKCPYCKGTGENLSNPMNSGACNKCGGTGDEYAALSTHPHASDKQGWLARDVEAATKRVAEWKNETTKSEGGVEGHARAQVDGRASEKGCISRGGEFTGSASGLLNSPQPEAGIKPGPSDRTADVTVDELAAMIVPEAALAQSVEKK